MKHSSYALSQSDIKAITVALSILPSFDFVSETNIDALLPLCTSAGSKLASRKSLSQQETYLIALAVDSAYKALRNEISSSEEIKGELKEYIFTYNKLEPVFSPLLSDM